MADKKGKSFRFTTSSGSNICAFEKLANQKSHAPFGPNSKLTFMYHTCTYIMFMYIVFMYTCISHMYIMFMYIMCVIHEHKIWMNQ